jgi:hypothetical protein
MSRERLAAFVVPIIAERDHVAIQAQGQAVRRGDETVPHLTLGQVVRDKLAAHGISADETDWDAWKARERIWIVQASYGDENDRHQARFRYDQTGRFSIADNPDAAFLVGIRTPKAVPKHTRKVEDESTLDLNPELALVRVLQPKADTQDEWDGALPRDWFPHLAPAVAEDEVDELDQDTASLVDLVDDTSDAYTEGELTLAEADGVYDYVQPQSNIDVLYEMLSSFDEDSVAIYRGLLSQTAAKDKTHESQLESKPEKPARQPAVQDQADGEASDVVSPEFLEDFGELELAGLETPIDAAEPSQPSLIDGAPETPEKAKPAKKPAKKSHGRVKVPSWDEIVFGAPRNKSEN